MVRHVLQADMAGWWRKIFHEDYSPIYAKTVRGYTFVGCHWDRGCGFCSGTEGKNPFLLLPEYMKEKGGTIDPRLPFFYVQHPHPRNTCNGEWAWGRDGGATTKALAD